MILAGDIGGTNTRLALVRESDQGHLSIEAENTFPSREYDNLGDIVREFLASNDAKVNAACFGVAGPVQNNRCKTMNLTWVVDAEEISASQGIRRVAVVNDLESNAYGIACLGSDDIDVINPGDPNAAGNACVVSPGTGLGEAGMYWDGDRYHPIATEGGHTDFAPRSRIEFELLEYLDPKYDHVSYERVVCGPGLVNIYNFLHDTGRGEELDWLAEEMKQGDAAAAISKAAVRDACPMCKQALDLFLELFGTEAGNVALMFMARGGVWLGGGIVVKLLDYIKSNDLFMKSFCDKGRLRGLMEKIPVRVILNDKTALLGAARYTFDFLA